MEAFNLVCIHQSEDCINEIASIVYNISPHLWLYRSMEQSSDKDIWGMTVMGAKPFLLHEAKALASRKCYSLLGGKQLGAVHVCCSINFWYCNVGR